MIVVFPEPLGPTIQSPAGGISSLRFSYTTELLELEPSDVYRANDHNRYAALACPDHHRHDDVYE